MGVEIVTLKLQDDFHGRCVISTFFRVAVSLFFAVFSESMYTVFFVHVRTEMWTSGVEWNLIPGVTSEGFERRIQCGSVFTRFQCGSVFTRFRRFSQDFNEFTYEYDLTWGLLGPRCLAPNM